MKLTVISHKIAWQTPESPSGFATTGGFPQQMAALADLFDKTTVLVTNQPDPPPPGLKPLDGRLTVLPLNSLPGRGWWRKVYMVRWLPMNIGRIWQAIRKADAIHIPVPGDVGLIGILVALAIGKPLFIRHCSQWGQKNTLTARFLLWLLERIAGGRNVVMATGASDQPPSKKNPAIQWIFSTTLTEAEWQHIVPARPWQIGQPLRLVTVGRLEPVKNLDVVLKSLKQLKTQQSQIRLVIVGDGSCMATLKKQASDLNLSDAVTFHGNVNHRQVIQILSTGHLFLMPSEIEGFPKAALEAMACGLPVIATAVSALSHLVGTENGALLATPAPEALAESVLQLMSDEAQLKRMSTNARQTARQYSLERWQAIIQERLTDAWGSLKKGGSSAQERPFVDQVVL